ncbi:hypothetical protein [Streptomyces sp. NPDC049881]|uniref:hypothetical protein n=1 Tax=Streptomyces sp. NPDC049881 TaxID=3155778 RepID=UPI00342E3A49
MSGADHDKAYAAWRDALDVLTAGAAELSEWQSRRFDFAYRFGTLLTAEDGEHGAVHGPALYGIYRAGAGLVYVGQTLKAERRLRDLPVGESHHVATTLPPELWERVVVVQWPRLVADLSDAEREHVRASGDELCGLALEHLVQLRTRPPLNARRRTADGKWRLRHLEASRSRGAVHARTIARLGESVRAAWQELEDLPVTEAGGAVLHTRAGRAVVPPEI